MFNTKYQKKFEALHTPQALTIKYIFPSFYSSFIFLKNAIGYYLSLAA